MKGSLEAIVACVGANDTRLATKAVFFSRALCEDDAAFAELFLKASVVGALAKALSLCEDAAFWEQSLTFARTNSHGPDPPLPSNTAVLARNTVGSLCGHCYLHTT